MLAVARVRDGNDFAIVVVENVMRRWISVILDIDLGFNFQMLFHVRGRCKFIDAINNIIFHVNLLHVRFASIVLIMTFIAASRVMIEDMCSKK